VAGTRPFIRSTRQRHDGRLLRRAHRVVGRVRSEGAWPRPGPDARLDVAEREPDAVPRDGCAHRICREVAASAPAVACARVQACNGRHKSIDTDGPPLVPPSHKPEHAGRLHRASTCARRHLDHDPTAAAVLRQTRCTQEQASSPPTHMAPLLAVCVRAPRTECIPPHETRCRVSVVPAWLPVHEVAVGKVEAPVNACSRRPGWQHVQTTHSDAARVHANVTVPYRCFGLPKSIASNRYTVLCFPLQVLSELLQKYARYSQQPGARACFLRGIGDFPEPSDI
jgi:hypothetical protein